MLLRTRPTNPDDFGSADRRRRGRREGHGRVFDGGGLRVRGALDFDSLQGKKELIEDRGRRSAVKAAKTSIFLEGRLFPPPAPPARSGGTHDVRTGSAVAAPDDVSIIVSRVRGGKVMAPVLRVDVSRVRRSLVVRSARTPAERRLAHGARAKDAGLVPRRRESEDAQRIARAERARSSCAPTRRVLDGGRCCGGVHRRDAELPRRGRRVPRRGARLKPGSVDPRARDQARSLLLRTIASRRSTACRSSSRVTSAHQRI